MIVCVRGIFLLFILEDRTGNSSANVNGITIGAVATNTIARQ